MSAQYELWLAIDRNDLSAVDALLAAGTSPNISLTPDEYFDWMIDMRKRNGLAGPIGSDARAILSRCYNPGENIGYYPVTHALERPKILARLLRAGASCETRSAISLNRPLHDLAENSKLWDTFRSAAHLIEADADLEAWDTKGRTPLQLCCWRKGDGRLISLLLECGASVDARDRGGNTALHGAGFWDEGYIPWPLDQWREFGEPVPEPDPGNGYDPVQYWGAREAVNALVDAGSDPNAVNPTNGYTPMHWASVHHGPPYLSFLEALFERGGRVDIKNRVGDRPLDMYVGDRKDEQLYRRFMEALGK